MFDEGAATTVAAISSSVAVAAICVSGYFGIFDWRYAGIALNLDNKRETAGVLCFYNLLGDVVHL